jgi:septum formation protein
VRLILASASPRRAELLTAAGFTFAVCPADVDERVHPGEEPRAYVRRLAGEKSARVLERLTSDPAAGADRDAGGDTDVLTLGADTAVVVDGTILGKPTDDADAARMIERLSGRSHLVLTGVSIRGRGDHVDAVDETLVHVRPLTPEEVSWYVRSGEGRDKAGGYAIQGLASRFISRIEGSYANVVGLPVELVDRLIRQYG